jgi:anti-anti-sigma factor
MFLIKDPPRSGFVNHFNGPEIVDISVDCSSGVAVVTLVGELDVSNSAWLHESLHNAIDTGISEVVVNLHSLTFMDSTGLSVIVGAHKRMQATGGTLTVLDPTPIVKKLLQITDDVPFRTS